MIQTNTYRLLQGSRSSVSSSHLAVQRERELYCGENDIRIAIREICILPGKEMEMVSSRNSIHLFLPVVGKVLCGGRDPVEVGEIMVKFAPSGLMIPVANCYSDSIVHLLHIQWEASHFVESMLLPFDCEYTGLDLQKILHATFPANIIHQGRVFFGKFKGREDGRLLTSGPSLGMVLSGAFEYQNRLLDAGDVLWSSDEDELEMECLTTEGILLVVVLDVQSKA